MEIPLLVPYYNAPSFLRNLVNWWGYYRPNDPVYILDNASDVSPFISQAHVEKITFTRREAWLNLAEFIRDVVKPRFSHYVISDPDIMPHPTTPADFLEVFKHCVDVLGYHHAGFGLIVDDIPEWVPPAIRDDAQRNEAFIKTKAPIKVVHDGRAYDAIQAPIDTTFALYSCANSGWSSPMPGPDWDSSLRLFRAFHLGWYIPEHPNAEMNHYFSTCRGPRDGEKGSACRNHYKPSKYNDRINEEWKIRGNA